ARLENDRVGISVDYQFVKLDNNSIKRHGYTKGDKLRKKSVMNDNKNCQNKKSMKMKNKPKASGESSSDHKDEKAYSDEIVENEAMINSDSLEKNLKEGISSIENIEKITSE
ncbi:4926_t:CDS:2, partial [Racocetra persica]